MEPLTHLQTCHGSQHSRRRFLKLASVAAAGAVGVTGGWITELGHRLARATEADIQAGRTSRHGPAKSLILLWMAGGPSQLETFDPHPGRRIAGGTPAINTAVKGVQFAAGYERLAEHAGHLALVRSTVSKEGDHERGTYTIKTGYRPDPTLIHPAVGAVVCHELGDTTVEIPRHISILPGQWPSRGGFLGPQYDAFQVYETNGSLPDVTAGVGAERDQKRAADLEVLEATYAHGRRGRPGQGLHRANLAAARKMMSSEQLKAFDITEEPTDVRRRYGDTAFGRGCLAARRLIEVGVRCVEVTLGGWDTHANNHELCGKLARELDPAFAALIADLKTRGRLDSTLLVWAGEFGRTPMVNALGGRDHWPTGFTVALAGGDIRGGTVVGATDPEGAKEPRDPRSIGDVHATILMALGIDPDRELTTPIARPLRLAEGKPIRELLVA